MAWRDRIKIHPAADLFPMMSDSELNELAADIRENGLRSGVALWTPDRIGTVSPRKGPSDLFLLDGRNRLEAIGRAYADPAARDEAIECALYIDHAQTGTAILVYGDDDPFAYVVSANIHRRHLTAEKKRDIIGALLRERPERSDNATAKIAQTSHNTVAIVRREMEEEGKVVKMTTRVGADGVQQPATRPHSKEGTLRAMREAAVKRANVSFTEASASEKRIESFIAVTRRLSHEELTVAREWFDEYCAEQGTTVFDNTKAGARA